MFLSQAYSIPRARRLALACGVTKFGIAPMQSIAYTKTVATPVMMLFNNYGLCVINLLNLNDFALLWSVL